MKILQSEYFQSYYERYKKKIEQKSKSQKQRNQNLKAEMEGFPYYSALEI